ncbi:MAG: hypothetical protein HOP17_07350 [Acidobacteria bacterium]|nr:hypothetical protein [Acidobacteriota bacterium]
MSITFGCANLTILFMKVRWQFGIIAGIFVAAFCLYPQFKMVYLRGDAWNGHYAYNDIDEVAYASYVRALIDGRPRKNDPYTGRDDSAATPQPESLFSIQFAAPYTIAIPARILGIGTPWAMTIAGALAGLLATLAAFWLAARMTGSNWFGMAGSIAVFAGGALYAGEGAALEIFFDGFSYPYFPGFRRYIPALAMTAFFIMLGSVWRMLEPVRGEADGPANDLHNRIFFGLIAVCGFAFTVFSYFYIWTTAAAFLGCLLIIWLIERPERWRRDIKLLIAVGGGFVAVLLPYAYLLSKRSDTMEHVQLLVYTRSPDLFRVPEYIGFAVLVILILGMATKHIEMKERSTLFVLSLALVPFIVFNQQILTGRSLQPIHYQVFIGNYVAGLALVLSLGLVLRRPLGDNRTFAKAACTAMAVAAVVWGFVECHYTVRVLDEANVERDLSLPVARRLEELGKNDADPRRTTVLAFDMIQSDDLPSVAPQNVLWARHQHVFAGLSWEESKERYYQYLHYSNIDDRGLDYLLKHDFVSQIALFGWGRHTDRLSFDSKPLTFGEVDVEVGNYWAYRQNFSRTQASNPLLSYVVVNNEADTDLSVLDRWYERDAGEVIGKYTLYRVRLRD